MIWYSLGMTVIGLGGGYVLADGPLEFALYHIGGLGSIGLLACASAAIARGRGYSYWRAWLIAVLLPVILGFVAAYIGSPGRSWIRPEVCGGSASLGTGLILIAVWYFMGQRRGEAE